MKTIEFSKHLLPNGLQIILHEDHSLPVTAVNIWYHVGSKNEEIGRTGFAHLFEHVMFEGSKNHNSSFFEPLQKIGAVLNGSTSNDRTNYWVNLPSNHLETVLWLESDRMGFLLEALDQKRFDIQRDVVKNERRQSYENRPYGMAFLELQPAAFPAPHPYNWPTIGSQKDLDAAKLEDVKDFFRKFYSPSNACISIAGDINKEQTVELVEKYFGDLSPGPSINRIGRTDSSLSGQVSLVLKDKVQLPRLYMVWPTPPAFSGEEAPLDLLSTILADGKSSRLYRKLVIEKQIAKDISVFNYAQEIAGEFFVQVTANPGESIHNIESIIREEIENISQVQPSDQELERAKNRITAYHVRQLEKIGGFGGRADLLNYYNTYLGNPDAINSDLSRYTDVTNGEITKVAARTLTKAHVRMEVLPEEERHALERDSVTIDRAHMPSGMRESVFSPPIPEKIVMENGMTVITMKKPGVALVSMCMLIRAGGITDPASKGGLADLTATMLSEGTSNRTSADIADQMEFLGAEIHSSASREYTTISTEVISDKWLDALDIIADITQNANFPESEYKRIQKEHLTDLSRIADNPVAIAARIERALQFGQDSQYGHALSGNSESVESINRTDLQNYFREFFRPDAATLIVVGDFDPVNSLAAIQDQFGNWEPQKSKHNYEGPQLLSEQLSQSTIYLADKPGAAQSVIRAGHLVMPRKNDSYFSMNIVNYIFGGQFSARLNMNLRQDKGYSYGYMSSIDWLHEKSLLSAGGSVQTEVTKEAIEETITEFLNIMDVRPITDEEFTDARESILRSFPAQFETQAQVLQQLVRLVHFDLPLDYFTTYKDKIDQVSQNDTIAAAKKHIDGNHLKIVVVGDANIIRPSLDELGIPIIETDYEGTLL